MKMQNILLLVLKHEYCPQNHSETLCPFRVPDQVPHPYKTAGTIMLLYILIFRNLDSRL
jgi:hypothetical protein